MRHGMMQHACDISNEAEEASRRAAFESQADQWLERRYNTMIRRNIESGASAALARQFADRWRRKEGEPERSRRVEEQMQNWRRGFHFVVPADFYPNGGPGGGPHQPPPPPPAAGGGAIGN